MKYLLFVLIVYIFIIMPPIRKRALNDLYAHRGYHLEDKSIVENTLESFQKAIDLDYGIELDVRLSKDGVVYVFHDDCLERLLGKPDQLIDLNSDEIDQLRLNGSIIPRFEDALELIDGQVDLIVELKTGNRNRELSKKVVELLDTYSGNFVIESFDPKVIIWFRFLKPSYTRGLLIMEAKEYDDHRFAPVWINLFLNFLARPDFMAAHKALLPMGFNLRLYKMMGGKLVSWTIHEKDPDYDCVDAMIFEYYKA